MFLLTVSRFTTMKMHDNVVCIDFGQ